MDIFDEVDATLDDTLDDMLADMLVDVLEGEGVGEGRDRLPEAEEREDGRSLEGEEV